MPKFVLNIIGRTGTRKSTLAALFLCFFGIFNLHADTIDFTEYLITNGEEYDEIFDLIISMLGVDKVFALLNKARKGTAAGAFDATADNLTVYEWLKSRTN